MNKTKSLHFILLLGLVSLFSDIAYEGARSISGPYLALLGANATLVGFIAGFGELVGYLFRIVSGFILDKTKRYWTITFWGYFINLIAIPLMAYAHNWQAFAILIIIERTGKAFRTPSRDTMLSHASASIGMGWGFGLHEALDRFGAMLGPLLIALVLYLQGNYQQSFMLLGIPAVIALLILLAARHLCPKPSELEPTIEMIAYYPMKKDFWIFVVGCCLVGAGYADFPLIAYHFQKTKMVTPLVIPLIYAIAVGFNTFASPYLGQLYDKYGFRVFFYATIIAGLFSPFVFLGDDFIALIGVILWSLGVGVQASIVRAIIAKMITKNKRGIAYGLFNATFGLSWFIGSFLIGYLYDLNVHYVVLFSLLTQIFATIALYFLLR